LKPREGEAETSRPFCLSSAVFVSLCWFLCVYFFKFISNLRLPLLGLVAFLPACAPVRLPTFPARRLLGHRALFAHPLLRAGTKGCQRSSVWLWLVAHLQQTASDVGSWGDSEARALYGPTQHPSGSNLHPLAGRNGGFYDSLHNERRGDYRPGHHAAWAHKYLISHRFRACYLAIHHYRPGGSYGARNFVATWHNVGAGDARTLRLSWGTLDHHIRILRSALRDYPPTESKAC